jgi:hypothetical protein
MALNGFTTPGSVSWVASGPGGTSLRTSIWRLANRARGQVLVGPIQLLKQRGHRRGQVVDQDSAIRQEEEFCKGFRHLIELIIFPRNAQRA